MALKFPGELTVDIYRHLGSAYYGNGEFTAAEKAYSKVLGVDKTNPWGYLGVGMVRDTLSRLDTSRTNNAISFLQKAIDFSSAKEYKQAHNLANYHLSRIFIDSEDDIKIEQGCSIANGIKSDDSDLMGRVNELKKRCYH